MQQIADFGLWIEYFNHIYSREECLNLGSKGNLCLEMILFMKIFIRRIAHFFQLFSQFLFIRINTAIFLTKPIFQNHGSRFNHHPNDERCFQPPNTINDQRISDNGCSNKLNFSHFHDNASFTPIPPTEGFNRPVS